MKRRKVILTFIICLIVCWHSHAQSDSSAVYLPEGELPDATAYLPAPPDTASTTFVVDFLQWQSGKTLRPTSRGVKANLDSQYGIGRIQEIYGNVLGLTISSSTTPAIYQLLQKSGATAALCIMQAQEGYPRKRPFAQMNESAWATHDNNDDAWKVKSYPSEHASYGWATALALAEAIPELQNEILSEGAEYGRSRVIAGANWQSDVDAAMLSASAAVACMHTSNDFSTDITAARNEYLTLTSSTRQVEIGLPAGTTFLPAPADTINNLYYGDVVEYWQMKANREGERGAQAIADAMYSDSAYVAAFAQVMRLDDANAISAITAMVEQAMTSFDQAADQMTNAYSFRKRPYVKLHEGTSIPDDESTYAQVSSYPSKSALSGWGVALLLAEIAPRYQNEILSQGFRYGESSAITGFHFASDIQDGRMLASAVVARLHADSQFAALLSAAKEEYITSVQP